MTDSEALELFPEPQKLRITAGEADRRLPSGFFSRSADAHFVSAWCRRQGLRAGDDADSMELRLVRRRDESTLYIGEARRLSDEKYFLSIRVERGRLVAEIVYAEDRGLRFALATVASLHRSGGFIPCEIEDYPNFPVRGIIEGFYGPPWQDDERLDMMSLLARYKMNAYVYGPKDDPYHRELWAVPYDEESLRRIASLYRAADEEGLDFCYSIGPGLSMRYAEESDFERLLAKLIQVYDLGVRFFALLLDDIPPILQYPEDRERFPDLVAGQIPLVTRIYDALADRDPAISFAVCPTEYHGRGNEYTVSRLGRSLHAAIDLFWTGPEICSRELTTRDAALFAEATLHRPLYWDNYPVNDLAMRNEMHIGPYENRDRDLWRFSRGIIANGMEYPESSKIPFITIACYAWNPESYDPERCHREAIRRLVGTRDAEDFSVFADNLRSSCLNDADSPRLAEVLERFRFAYLYGENANAFEELDTHLAPYLRAAEHLHAGLENEKLARELRRWIQKYCDGIALLQASLASLRDGTPTEALRAAYEAYMDDPTRVFGDVLYSAVDLILNRGLTRGNG